MLVIARKEWLDIRRDARWRALALVTASVDAGRAALWACCMHERMEREHHAAEVGDRHVWTAQGAKNPHSAAHFGQYAFKPIGPLAMADPGIDAYVGSAVYLEAHRQNEVQFRAARDATLAARMGHLTLAFVFQTVLPLMAILLGFAAFSGEREQGTLRQLLSLGVRPVDLLLGKAAGECRRADGLCSCGERRARGRAGAVRPASSDARPAVMARGWPAWFWLTRSTCSDFSHWRWRSRREHAVRAAALVGLLVFWLLNSFLVPRWVTDVVRNADPLPTALAFREAIAEDKKKLFGHDENHPGFIAFRDRVLEAVQGQSRGRAAGELPRSVAA